MRHHDRLNRLYNTDWIERCIAEDDAYKTVEELKEAEKNKREKGRINWDVWYRVVEETRREIVQWLLKNPVLPTPPKERERKEVYVYNYDGQQIAHYTNVDEASNALGFNKGTIMFYCWKGRPYLSERLYFSYTPMEIEDVKQAVSKYVADLKAKHSGGKMKPVEKWVYNYKTNEFLGHFSSTIECAEAFNIKPDSVNYYSWMKKPYKKHNLMILNEPMNESNKNNRQTDL